MTGVGILLRSHLRRDRWMILWWCLGGALLYWSQAISIAGLYADQAEFDRAAATMDGNAAFIAMAGPARALNTVGGQVFWQATAFGAIVAGLMGMFLIGRHSRAEEESGRDELVRSAAVGRHAPMTAALLVALIANLAMGLLVAASLLTVRQDSPLKGMPLPAPDSIATGLGLTACGWVFAGAALVAAQLTQSTRVMYGLTGAVIGAAYGLRAVGDVGDGVLSWLSPIGWYQAMAAYADLTWWPVLLMILAAAVMAAAAYWLFERRDVGAGLLADRPGPATAGPGLRTSLGLAWRLQRGTLYGWTVGLAFTGVAYGSIGDSVDDLLGDSEFAQDALSAGMSGDLVDGFYATAIVLLALLTCGYGISSCLRPRAEEDAGHLENVLATATGRREWLLGHVLITVLGSLVVLGVGGLAMGLGYALITGDGGAILRIGLPAFTYVAPVLVLTGIARLLYGLSPRLMGLAWLPLVFAVVVQMFAEVFRFPDWVRDLSPFSHLALAPAEDVRWLPVVVVTVIAAVLSVGGQVAFRRRDIG